MLSLVIGFDMDIAAAANGQQQKIADKIIPAGGRKRRRNIHG
ncbi:hypothetical protein ACVBGC_15150 [Burkholderia stagnalis]